MGEPAEKLGPQNPESPGRPANILRVEDALICSGIEPMIIPQGGAHVRSAEVRIPAKFAGEPTVTATVHQKSGTPGQVFGIFGIAVNELGNETQVVFNAANVQAGQPVDVRFVCSYVVIGKVEGTQ